MENPVKNKKLQKTIAWTVLLTFIFTNTSFSAPATGGSVSLQTEKNTAEMKPLSLASQLEIPETLGTVQERFIPQGVSAATIIHIQDAHASNDAQANIRGILEHLSKTYGIKEIFLEGGLGEVRPELMLYFKDEALNKKLGQRFQKESLIGGAELFLLDDYYQQHTASAYGLEHAPLYKQNLEDFRAVMSEKENSKKFLEGLKSQILTQSSKVFSKDLKNFFREWAFYQDTQDEVMRHFQTLSEEAKKQALVDLREPQAQLEWPQLVRLVRLKDLEGKVDRAKVEQEKKAVEEWIKEHSAEGIEHRAEGIGEKTKQRTFRSFWSLSAHTQKFKTRGE